MKASVTSLFILSAALAVSVSSAASFQRSWMDTDPSINAVTSNMARSEGPNLEARHSKFLKILHKAIQAAEIILRRDDDQTEAAHFERRGAAEPKILYLALAPQGERSIVEMHRRGPFKLFRKIADHALHLLDNVIPQGRSIEDLDGADARPMARRDAVYEQDNEKRMIRHALNHLGTASDVLSLGQTAWSFVHPRDEGHYEQDNEKRMIRHALNHLGTASDVLSLGQTAWSYMHPRDEEHAVPVVLLSRDEADLMEARHWHHHIPGGLSMAADAANLVTTFA